MRILSIHVDESGDFGEFSSKYAPQYIFTLVFHEQEHEIKDDIKHLDKEMANLGYFNHVIHTGPLIRKEDVYCNLSPNERRTIFTRLFFFTKKLPVTYKSFLIERKEYPDETQLQRRINELLSRFIDEHLSYFIDFDQIILYYDNGQTQLAHELMDAFGSKTGNLHRKPDVRPRKYKLIQVADMICTLALLDYKAEHNELTRSELLVFHSVKDLRKEFLKKIRAKEFK